jgi:hypothetical protein
MSMVRAGVFAEVFSSVAQILAIAEYRRLVMRHGYHCPFLRIFEFRIIFYPILDVPAILKKRPHHVLEVVFVNVVGIPVEPHLLDAGKKSARSVKLMPISGAPDQRLDFCHHDSVKNKPSPSADVIDSQPRHALT